MLNFIEHNKPANHVFAEEDSLTDEQTAILKQRLEDELSQCAERVMNAEITGPEHSADVVDRATLEEERMLQAAAMGRLTNRIKEIRAALRRMDEGEYGYCEESGEFIGFDRLFINPACRYSVYVQAAKEKGGAMMRRS